MFIPFNNIDRFIKNNRISDIFIGAWEHQNRGVCWINNELVALVYIPYTEGDEDVVKETIRRNTFL